jgi:cytochrome c2
MNARLSSLSVVAAALSIVGCGASDSSSAPFAEYRIVAPDGSAPAAMVGDALRLSVVEMRTDGRSVPVSGDALITWSGPSIIEALPTGSTPDQSILPEAGAAPAAMWVKNPEHLSAEELAGVLFVLDAGSAPSPSISVTVTVVGGAAPNGHATASVHVAPFPAGNVARGQDTFAANCASCHGAHGEGESAPGLNDEPDHVAGDSAWTPQLLGLVARSNMDDQGVSLDPSMPKWLTKPDASGKLLTTQGFADMYAFLKTQHGTTPKL